MTLKKGINARTKQPRNSISGSVKITSIEVQSALEAMLADSRGPHANWLPKSESDWEEWTAIVQAQQVMELRPSSDNNNTIEQIPISAGKFEFEQPDVVAYVIEIEHEGIKLTKTYNPFVYHAGASQESLEDFIGPVQSAVTLVTEEKIDSVVNPADVMNQWNASWRTQMGIMELTQTGKTVSGRITEGDKTYTVEGTVTDGVFRGSYIVPTESGFGEINSIEMVISADGKSIEFRSIGADSKLKKLSGTRAVRQ